MIRIAARRAALALLLTLAGGLHAGDRPLEDPAADHAELAALFAQDQADRRGDAIDRQPDAVAARDRQRTARALELLRSGQVRTVDDHLHAAMLFQHSRDHVRLAHALASIANALDPQDGRATWMMAASWDRMLMHRLQPQWYGTQVGSNDDGVFLFPVAPGAVTDAERRRLGLPTLAEAEAAVPDRARAMGRRPASRPPDIDRLRRDARSRRESTL